MARLRAPGGCPWDREQTFDTIKPYTLEETYEVLDAIDRRDWPHLAEELGDLMLQCVFYAQMAEEQSLFDIGDSLEAINQKLVRRHPHVFAEGVADTPEEVKKRWDEIKADEKRTRARARNCSSKAFPVLFPHWSRRNRSHRARRARVSTGTTSTRSSTRCTRSWTNSRKPGNPAIRTRWRTSSATALRPRESRAVSEGGPRAGVAQDERKIPEQVWVRRARLRERGKRLTDSDIEEMEALWQRAKQEL